LPVVVFTFAKDTQRQTDRLLLTRPSNVDLNLCSKSKSDDRKPDRNTSTVFKLGPSDLLYIYTVTEYLTL
jgi:hypothetical protein